ncbi:peptidase S9, prolyl oligopeptidase active site region [Thalassoporum mexicanum PCC 7367]|uniref:S9 family peptidase n=1 Tax=Thalassoporum mexicanum TaxID=3457544 RepID=UPI00029F8C54|nr:S9 family peptidase [Pseudanabaena sp. PCC 7367]AFY70598.1 peptidase S9, prolyl oligopeptidase active site region [Pseudanabaena sp. PCC 7367]
MSARSAQEAPYGSWKSPITADLLVSQTNGFGQMALSCHKSPVNVYWLEARPAEAGRNVLVQWDSANQQIVDITPAPFNVRTRVHEYGGGAYLVADSTIYFVNFSDQRIYKQEIGDRIGEPQPLTPENSDFRYADMCLDRDRQRLICVREDHSGDGEAVNTIVSINCHDGSDIKILVKGADFYSNPTLKPDGSQLAWLSWQHPNMPWDGTQLSIADFQTDHTLANPQLVAGSNTESIFQPQWSPDGVLFFVSDRNDWWNLYRYSNNQVEAIWPTTAEFGLPQWVFGMSTYAFISSTKLVCSYTQQGRWHLATFNLSKNVMQDLQVDYTSMGSLHAIGENVAFIGGQPTEFSAIVHLNLTTNQDQELKTSSKVAIDNGYLSIPQEIEFPTENNQTAFAFFYAPVNKDFQAPATEKPPLIVRSHGGPTAATSNALSLKIQYWTSRGFAVLDVNYGGSTGYGRKYRQRLNGKWGIVDIDDCINGAKYLADRQLVDPERMAIVGGSSGGYTTLAALTFRDVFKAGAVYYGVSDLEILAKETHKFESRYLDSIVGAYPEQKAIYEARSPIHHVDQLACPVIFFQGAEDKITPPNQTEMMVTAIKQKGIPVAYVLYEGEQHGFRQAANIKRTLEAELYFYSQVFGFPLAEEIEPVAIENL